MPIKCTSVTLEGTKCLENQMDKTNSICALCHIKRFFNEHYNNNVDIIKFRKQPIKAFDYFKIV